MLMQDMVMKEMEVSSGEAFEETSAAALCTKLSSVTFSVRKSSSSKLPVIISSCHLSWLQVVLHYSTIQQTELTSALDNATAACANVTLRDCNVTREDMDGVITAVLDKLSEECKEGGCLFTEPLKTMVTESFGK